MRPTDLKEDLPPGLDALVQPMSRADFLRDYWGVRHFSHHSLSSINPLFAKRVAALDVPEILRFAEDPVIVMHHTNKGRYCGSRVSPPEAFGFYESGMALYFNLDPQFEDVKEWTNKLASDLGHSPNRCKASLFITPSGWQTELHFDPNENITLQLRGCKIWQVSKNTQVDNPIDRYTLSDSRAARMGLYHPETATIDPPDTLEAVTLNPGSTLYLPRGYWHSVKGLEESLSLNFCLIPETWSTFLMPVIERLFSANLELRGIATGAVGNPDLRARAKQDLGVALKVASDLLSSLKPEHILPDSSDTANFRPDHANAAFCRNRVATIGAKTKTADCTRVDITIGAYPESAVHFGLLGKSKSTHVGPSRRTSIDLSESGSEILTWICNRDSFTIGELRSVFAGVKEAYCNSLITTLVKAGLLYEVPAC